MASRRECFVCCGSLRSTDARVGLGPAAARRAVTRFGEACRGRAEVAAKQTEEVSMAMVLVLGGVYPTCKSPSQHPQHWDTSR
jgi:hypothetical protein